MILYDVTCNLPKDIFNIFLIYSIIHIFIKKLKLSTGVTIDYLRLCVQYFFYSV